MGSICNIITKPQNWIAYDSGLKCKEKFGGEDLIKIKFGTFDDDPDGLSDMEMYIRKSIYEKLLNGTYTVSKESSLKRKLIILDENNFIVPSLSDENIY